jgi:serine/threonine-protein kinase
LDRYELVRPVARGGMGIVWEARTRRTHGFEKKFALKTLLPNLAQESAFRAMFLDEMRIASSISHPNVCEVIDFGEVEGTLFLALEWIEGVSLQSLLQLMRKLKVTTPPALAARIAWEVAGGLHAAHELRGPDGASLQVVHRDVTPHNIIVRADGVAKLVDFGIAKAKNRLADETTAGTAKGKLRFMAPEQLRGGDLDRRTDVRALCAVLYALLTGKNPYGNFGDADTLLAIMRGEPIGPPVAGLRPSLQAAMDRALAADREARFASTQEFAAALSHAYPELHQNAAQGEIVRFVRYLNDLDAGKTHGAFQSALGESAKPDARQGNPGGPHTPGPARDLVGLPVFSAPVMESDLTAPDRMLHMEVPKTPAPPPPLGPSAPLAHPDPQGAALRMNRTVPMGMVRAVPLPTTNSAPATPGHVPAFPSAHAQPSAHASGGFPAQSAAAAGHHASWPGSPTGSGPNMMSTGTPSSSGQDLQSRSAQRPTVLVRGTKRSLWPLLLVGAPVLGAALAGLWIWLRNR